MTRQVLEAELHTLEEVSERTLGYTPTCLKAACAAAEVGDLTTCRTIIDRSITTLRKGEINERMELSAKLIGLFNGLTDHPTAA